MRAVRLTEGLKPAELCDVDGPAPGPGEVLLRVRGAGLCHSDLHLMHWPAGSLSYDLPFTLGHEVAGTVIELGDGASGAAVGDDVLVYSPWGCGAGPRARDGARPGGVFVIDGGATSWMGSKVHDPNSI